MPFYKQYDYYLSITVQRRLQLSIRLISDRCHMTAYLKRRKIFPHINNHRTGACSSLQNWQIPQKRLKSKIQLLLILSKMIAQAKQNLSHLVSTEKVAFPLHMWMISLFNYCLGNDTYCSCLCTQMSSTEIWWCCQSTFYILFCTGHACAVGMHSVTHDYWVSGCVHLSGLYGSCPSQTWRDVITSQYVQLKSTSPEGGHLDSAKASPRMTLNTVRKTPRW